MPDSQPLFDALLEDMPSPVTDAVKEARRTRQSRHNVTSTAVVVMLIGIFASVWLCGKQTEPQEVKIVTVAPGLRLFSTAETPLSLRQNSTSEVTHRIALFSNKEVQPGIHEIDDRSLFELLHPYAPVIVYLGRGEQPTLLLLHDTP